VLPEARDSLPDEGEVLSVWLFGELWLLFGGESLGGEVFEVTLLARGNP
jgi:hypothetical protein